MPLPDFNHSPYGYWIDLERKIYPLETAQSHAEHPAISGFAGEGHERIQNALNAGYAAVSLFGGSFAIRTREGAVPTGVIGDLHRIATLHGPEEITTDHHGQGPTKQIIQNMRRCATHTVSSSPGGTPIYSSPWQEISDLKQRLAETTAERDSYLALATESQAQAKLKDLFKRINGLKPQFKILQTNYKKAEGVVGESNLSSEKKLESLGYWVFHEMNRQIWYCGKLLEEIHLEDDSKDV